MSNDTSPLQSENRTMLYTCRFRESARYMRLPLVALLSIIFIFAIIMMWRVESVSWNSMVESRQSSPTELFGIVLDAGSTGSRIHVFRMKRNPEQLEGREAFELISEEFYSVKPGLSSYASDPKKAAASLEPLLSRARKTVPVEQWGRTLTALRATAGLRLLSEATASRILSAVRETLQAQGLPINADSVKIMDGEEEGILSWLTLNFMRRLLARPSSTVGALDLGGGSTQITFLPANANTEMEAPKGFMVSYPLGPRTLRLYTHSYLGLGLMAARLQMLGGRLHGKNKSPLSSACLPPNYEGKWRYSSQEITVKADGLIGFQSCFETAQNLVTEMHAVDWPEEARQRTFYAFSYFFDRAEDAHLFTKGSPGRLIEVREFKEAAKKTCAVSSPRKPFLCMDLCFISALFLKGYHFKETTVLHVVKRIGKVELSWGLGLMLKLLYEAEKSSPKVRDITQRDSGVSL